MWSPTISPSHISRVRLMESKDLCDSQELVPKEAASTQRVPEWQNREASLLESQSLLLPDNNVLGPPAMVTCGLSSSFRPRIQRSTSGLITDRFQGSSYPVVLGNAI